MMKLRRELTFDAAHYLPSYGGKCERLHGHTYRLLVELEGEPDDEGMIMDFADLKRVIGEQVLSSFDHMCLNDIMPVPSAENIARWIFTRLEGPVCGERRRLSSVCVWETAGSSAEFAASDMERCGGVTAAVFDFDMTLVDTCDAIAACVSDFARSVGLAPVGRDDVMRAIGLKIDDMWRSFWGRSEPEWTQGYRVMQAEREHEGFKLFASTKETLRALRAVGIRTAVVTNRTLARWAVEGVGLSELFDEVIGLETLNEPKPAPGMLHLAMRRLGSTPERTIYAGDTDIDMKTALAAGVRGIGMTTGAFSAEALMEVGAAHACSDLIEIATIAGIGRGQWPGLP